LIIWGVVNIILAYPPITFIFENMSNKVIPNTKLAQLLNDFGMSQTDLYYLIMDKTGKTIGQDRIHKMYTGKLTNYSIDTAKTIAQTLGVSLDEIVD
jgi:hypothetical protein